MAHRWDIFCKVVDNFGDAGVTWRLARQLVQEHGIEVRLWIDDLAALARLCPELRLGLPEQTIAGVHVCHWREPWPDTSVAEVVIEAFGCKLPTVYEQRLMGQRPVPVWVNLDYLSAESWVGGCHGLPSMKSGGVRKFFFFPGFREDTGGLLREAGLLERRVAFQESEPERQAFLGSLGIKPAEGTMLLSLFAYENPGIAGWFEQLAIGPGRIQVVVPEGRALADVQAWAGEPLAVGSLLQRGQLSIQVLPFLSQPDYDRLLWACDFNAVRGEDSFVRAQWASRPMLWHIYHQDDYAHWEKLEAFLSLYTAAMPEAAADALRTVWRAWNMDGDMASGWAALAAHWPTLRRYARQWCEELATRPDLATALVQFCRNSL
ncbi:elongation factor P maturation arginine rhamnosyltransferase EarP [Pseudomonas massiliensis]|uniref:elongation factor P maturation arginine rhamnosyltransferase EarP n=1 Tax=Pseudomonas massiliensis TaxID=522492 RepID=UPI00058C863E|nr:elongation factor P maturation arginine rhamnosyltransferase EarP [Pseudomonas massiliensis]